MNEIANYPAYTILSFVLLLHYTVDFFPLSYTKNPVFFHQVT